MSFASNLRIAILLTYLAILIIISLLPFVYVYYKNKDTINFYLASFFRDVSIYKSRRRLFNKDYQLITFLFSKHEIQLKRLSEDDLNNLVTMTLSELKQYNGETDETPIYISIDKKIYDVSSNRKNYKPGKGYHCFVGRDATLNYATGCTDMNQANCPRYSEHLKEGYNKEELEAINKWEEFYWNHDKYKLVGYLVPDVVEDLVNRQLKLDAIKSSEQSDEKEL